MRKQYLLKTFLCIAMLAIVGFDVLFAAGEVTTNADQNIADLALIINFFLNILSWARIIFAHIAGSLLTNTWVYGEAIGFDTALWVCRNMIKNISNFLLGFVFIFYLFKTLFGQAEASSVIKDIVIKILVAGVAIQSSRFLVAAILDVSTIATSAVGAFPAQLVADNQTLSQGMKNSALYNQLKSGTGTIVENMNNASEFDLKIVKDIFPKDTHKEETRSAPMTSSLTAENLADLLLPTADSLVGPLVFIGTSILELNGVGTIKYDQPLSSLIKLIFEGLGIILYSLAMIFLSIIAFMRILYLRMFIVLSPLVILLFCLTSIGKNDAMKEIEGISKTMKEKGFDGTGFIKLAFKPVIVTLGISMAFLISLLMKVVIETQQQSFEVAGTTIQSSEEKNTDPKTYHTSVENGVFQVVITGLNKTFGQLLLSFVTLVMMGFIIKIAITSGSGIKFIDDITKKNVERVQKLAGNLPVIPIGGGLSFSSIYNRRNGLIDNIEKYGNKKVAEMETERQEALNERLGFTDNRLTATDKENLKNTLIEGGKWDSFINQSLDLNTLKDGKRKEVGLGVPEWAVLFEKWLITDFGNNEPLSGTNARKLRDNRKAGKKENENLTLEAFITKKVNADLFREIFNDKGPATGEELLKRRFLK